MEVDPSKPPCRDAIASMYSFLDKELKSIEIHDIQQHIDECLPCLEAFEFEAELRTLIAAKCREEVPDYLYERIRINIRAAHPIQDTSEGTL